MNEREREIDTLSARRGRRNFSARWSYGLVVIGGVALLSVLVPLAAAAPMKFEGQQLGHIVAEGNYVVTTRKGAQYRHDTIQLDNGATITLDLLPGPRERPQGRAHEDRNLPEGLGAKPPCDIPVRGICGRS